MVNFEKDFNRRQNYREDSMNYVTVWVWKGDKRDEEQLQSAFAAGYELVQWHPIVETRGPGAGMTGSSTYRHYDVFLLKK